MAADAEGRPQPPGTPPRSGQDSAGAGGAGVTPSAVYGPLRVERHRKDDGRSLILYSWNGDSGAADA